MAALSNSNLTDAHLAEQGVRTEELHSKQAAMLAEKRSRLLRATRQTYEDFFSMDYIGSGHVVTLKVSFDHAHPCPSHASALISAAKLCS